MVVAEHWPSVDLPKGADGVDSGARPLSGGRFISLLPEFGEGAAAGSGGEIRLVLNWFEELKRLVPN